MHKQSIAILLFLLGILLHSGAAGQGMYTDFGKNTLQYRSFQWKYISTDNFDAYFYDEEINLAEYSIKAAEEQLKKVEQIIDYRLGYRAQIIIFTSLADMRQSNLLPKNAFSSNGGYTYSLENKVLVYFDGDHNHLDQQIRYGISQVLLYEMIFGGSLQERIQANALLSLPAWFYKGLVSYLSNPWDTRLDAQLRNGFVTRKYRNMNLLSPEDAEIAGHSFWRFIAENYGKRAIPEIIYLTRVSKGYESAVTYVTGNRTERMFSEWENFYLEQYNHTREDDLVRSGFTAGLKKDLQVNQAKISPDGKYVIFSTFRQGKYEAFVYQVNTRKRTRIFHKGSRSATFVNDEIYPVLSWDHSGRKIFLFYPDKGVSTFKVFNLKGETISEKKFPELKNILGVHAHPDGEKLVLSATKNGQSDLFLYDLKEETLAQLTNDYYDDMYPRFSTAGNSILFSSNRNSEKIHQGIDTIRPLREDNNFDIYLMEYPGAYNKVKRITNTPYINEIQPYEYAGGYIAYLSDNNGIYNVYLCKSTTGFGYSTLNVSFSGKDSVLQFSFPLDLGQPIHKIELFADSFLYASDTVKFSNPKNVFTDTYRVYPLGNRYTATLLHDFGSEAEKELQVLKYLDQYRFIVLDASDNVVEDSRYLSVEPTAYRKKTGHQVFFSDSSVNAFLVEKKVADTLTTDSVVVNDSTTKAYYYFQTDFPDIPSAFRKRTQQTEKTIYNYDRPKAYRLAFFPENLETQLIDNSIVNTYYHVNNPFASTFNRFSKLSARVDFAMSDLMGDHIIRATGRLPLSFYGTDISLGYENRKHRHDVGISFFRQSRLAENVPSYYRIFIHELRLHYSIPLNESNSIRFAAFGRQDKNVLLGTDSATLSTRDNIYSWTGARGAFVHDNIRYEEINFPVGNRFKVFGEYFLNTGNALLSTFTVGIDWRNYYKLHKKVLWANRVAYNTSIGSSKVLYLVGGIENWLGSRFNNELGVATTENYSLQLMAASLRGFQQNVRNGASYFSWNSELRIPVFAYLRSKPINSDFLRNLLFVPFLDIASAWNGTSPWSDQHYNTRVVDQGSVSIVVRSSNNPFLAAIGTGFRTRIFGYYLRADAGWGIQNSEISKKPLWSFGLGYDF